MNFEESYLCESRSNTHLESLSGTRGEQPITDSCPGGMVELRHVCNATVGRKLSPVVETIGGKIQGFVDSDSSHYNFRGIPYAAPPIGDLRWRPPQPPVRCHTHGLLV
jgi:hypothetical protein